MPGFDLALAAAKSYEDANKIEDGKLTNLDKVATDFFRDTNSFEKLNSATTISYDDKAKIQAGGLTNVNKVADNFFKDGDSFGKLNSETVIHFDEASKIENGALTDLTKVWREGFINGIDSPREDGFIRADSIEKLNKSVKLTHYDTDYIQNGTLTRDHLPYLDDNFNNNIQIMLKN